MINKVILVGNLGKDPELKKTESSQVCNFSLATSKKYKDETQTTWHNIVMWGKVAEIAEKYLKKGSKVYLEGEIVNRSYNDKDGNKKYISEVVCFNMQMLDGKSNNDTGSAPLGNDTSVDEDDTSLPF